MNIPLTFRTLFFGGGLISLALLLCAYLLEYFFNLVPCPLCYLQRFVLFGIIALFWLGTLQNCKKTGRLIYCGSVFTLSTVGILLAARQLWIQIISPVSESNCLAGFEKMLQFMPLWEVLKETIHGTQECSAIDFTVLFLPLSAWSLFSFMGFAIFSIMIGWLQIKRRI
jgi:disulfide bond formation protein DsbB